MWNYQHMQHAELVAVSQVNVCRTDRLLITLLQAGLIVANERRCNNFLREMNVKVHQEYPGVMVQVLVGSTEPFSVQHKKFQILVIWIFRLDSFSPDP